jgi:hypothetical protein
MSLSPLSDGQDFFPAGEDVVFQDGDKLIIENGSPNGLQGCHYESTLPSDKPITKPEIRIVEDDNKRLHLAVTYTRSNKKIDDALFEQFMLVCGSSSAARHNLRTAATATPTPGIPISNDADTFEITCDGHYAAVVGANSTKPVSLVDLITRTEVATFTFNGLSQSVSICDDSHSVLVHLDTNAGGASSVRRLIINGASFTDTMETLAIGSSSLFINKVIAAPGSKTGLALVTEFFMASPPISRLVSFGIPGLVMIDSVDLAGRFGNAVTFNCNGTKIYARSGDRGVHPDIIECFNYDPLTGQLGNAASMTINNVSFMNVPVYANPLAVTLDGKRLIAPEPNGSPTPRVGTFDATTGARLGNLPGTFVNPNSAFSLPCCQQPKTFTSIARMPTGHILLQGQVISPNWTFSLQVAPNMTTSFGSPISLTSDSNGMFQYDDAGTVGLDKRFYRLTFP